MPVATRTTAVAAVVADLRPLAACIRDLQALLGMVRPVPTSWLGNGNVQAIGPTPYSKADMAPKPCDNYKELVDGWRRALKWTDGLDKALSVMLASVLSTKIVGDQLWVKIMGPPSCGKTTLCEGISVAKEYVVSKSTIRGFHSGYDSGNGEDNSLVSKLFGKTLVTKDGDTLLQAPNLGQILAEARDLYDSTARTHYRNAKANDYQGVRMTWILCGTNSLRVLDHSELGARFLDCVIMEHVDDDLEDEILWRVANRVDRNMAVEANGKPETRYEPELAHAMAVTGGMACHLRRNAVQLLSGVSSSENTLRYLTRLGKFVAFMRARPSDHQDEHAEREFAARLVSQHIRLAKCLGAVLNTGSLDDEVLYRTRSVGLDTARGQSLNIARRLFKEPRGVEARGLAIHVNQPEDKLKKFLRFLRAIRVVEHSETDSKRWVLTARVRKLYGEVMGNG